ERNLQTLSNYLVFSLAIADLMVACLVMPIGAQYEVMNQEWLLGSVMCEIWTSGMFFVVALRLYCIWWPYS
ncbi:5-hydroxytryptamine receptor, partial [Caerostris extrusa]